MPDTIPSGQFKVHVVTDAAGRHSIGLEIAGEIVDYATPDQAEAFGLALIRSAERARVMGRLGEKDDG